MSVSEEQEEEFEALQAIYPEIERYEESPEQPLLIFAIDLASETEENQLRYIPLFFIGFFLKNDFSVRLQISMPETYPEIAPECDVLEYSDSLDPADCVNIEKFIRETCEDQLGEIMCFTIIR